MVGSLFAISYFRDLKLKKTKMTIEKVDESLCYGIVDKGVS